MIRLHVNQWTQVCGVMRQEDGNFLVAPICIWLTGLVDEARAVNREFLEIYEGNFEFVIVREFCEKAGVL